MLGYPLNTKYCPLAPGHSNQARLQRYLIGERRVHRHNKTLDWLGSSSAAGVFDSNGRDQRKIPDIGEAAQHPGQIIRGWTSHSTLRNIPRKMS